MKKLITMAVALTLAFNAGAQTQKIPNNVMQRLEPISEAVQLTGEEMQELVMAIQEFQTNTNNTYKENPADKKERIASIRGKYESELKRILGDERYAAWKSAEKKTANAGKEAANPVAQVPASAVARLDLIRAAVEITEDEQAELIRAITAFQNQTNAARASGDKEKAKQVNNVYQAELKRILGADRYNTFRKSGK